MYLDDFGANLKGAGAELLAGTVRILSVDHTDVGTASGRDHLQRHTHKLHYTGHGKVKQQDMTIQWRMTIDLDV